MLITIHSIKMCARLSDLKALTWQRSGPGLHSVLQPGSTVPPQTAYGTMTLSAGPWQQQESKRWWQPPKPGIYINVGAVNVTHACGISHRTQSRLTRGTVSEDKPFTCNRNNSATATWQEATPSESSYTSADGTMTGLKSLYYLVLFKQTPIIRLSNSKRH